MRTFVREPDRSPQDVVPCDRLQGGQSITATMVQIIFLGLLVGGFNSPHTFAADNTGHSPGPNLFSGQAKHPRLATQEPRRTDFEGERASRDVRQTADWVVDSGDNHQLPFVIIDKVDAKVFVFYPDGKLRGVSPALLGSARGDHAAPGIGTKKLSSILPEERTTPAGRFVAALGYNLRGKDILWVDYDGAVSLHRVATAKPEERRLERLATPTPLDNRISYGCINVPAKFFDTVVRPAFTGTNGIVYVLPETKPARGVFGSYEV